MAMMGAQRGWEHRGGLGQHEMKCTRRASMAKNAESCQNREQLHQFSLSQCWIILIIHGVAAWALEHAKTSPPLLRPWRWREYARDSSLCCIASPSMWSQCGSRPGTFVELATLLCGGRASHPLVKDLRRGAAMALTIFENLWPVKCPVKTSTAWGERPKGILELPMATQLIGALAVRSMMCNSTYRGNHTLPVQKIVSRSWVWFETMASRRTHTQIPWDQNYITTVCHSFAGTN